MVDVEKPILGRLVIFFYGISLTYKRGRDQEFDNGFMSLDYKGEGKKCVLQT